MLENRWKNLEKQAGADLGQAQLPTGIWMYFGFLLPYIDQYEMTRDLVLLYLLSRPTFQFTPFYIAELGIAS